jgi:hypothetical protein
MLPLVLGIAVGQFVGFGPCGPNVGSSVRGIVLLVGIIALSAPFISARLFWVSFRRQSVLSGIVGLPLLCGSFLVSCYWFFIVLSAVMS